MCKLYITMEWEIQSYKLREYYFLLWETASIILRKCCLKTNVLITITDFKDVKECVT